MWIRGGWESIKIFPSQIYCLVMPTFFVGESFDVALVSGFEKQLGIREGAETTNFLQICFVSHYRLVHKGTILCYISENFRQREVYG